MSGQCGAEDFLEHILVDTSGNFAWKILCGKFGSMTNEATGVVCPGYHVGTCFGLVLVYPSEDLSASSGLWTYLNS